MLIASLHNQPQQRVRHWFARIHHLIRAICTNDRTEDAIKDDTMTDFVQPGVLAIVNWLATMPLRERAATPSLSCIILRLTMIIMLN